MADPWPEPSLARALAEGRPEAFAALYDRLAPAMYRVARTILADPHQAEDVVHDVFVSLVRARDHLSQVEDLDAYIFASLRRAAVNQSIREHRATRNINKLAASSAQSCAPTSDVSRDDLDAALSLLPADQRKVIALKIDADLTFAQIARVLGVSPNTAASRYRYALEKLRRSMEESL